MPPRTLLELLDATIAGTARAVCRVNSLESTRHLRTSGAELLRAVRASLDDVIEVVDPGPGAPPPRPAATEPQTPKVE